MAIPPDSMSLASSLMKVADLIHPTTDKGKKMAEATEVEVTKPTKRPVKKVTKKAAPAAKKAGPPKREIPNGHTSLADLCKKAKVQAVAARRRLRAAGIERKEGSQYSWPAGSHAKILGIIKGETE